MTNLEKSTCESLIGKQATRAILAYAGRFVRYGVCRKEDKNDLIHDLLLVCLKAKSNVNGRGITDPTYLCACVRHAAGRQYVLLKRNRSYSFAWAELCKAHQKDDEESCPLDFLSAPDEVPVWANLEREWLLEAIHRLARPGRDILLYALREHRSPSTVCALFGKSRNFYQRELEPQLRKMLTSEKSSEQNAKFVL